MEATKNIEEKLKEIQISNDYPTNQSKEFAYLEVIQMKKEVSNLMRIATCGESAAEKEKARIDLTNKLNEAKIKLSEYNFSCDFARLFNYTK